MSETAANPGTSGRVERPRRATQTLTVCEAAELLGISRSSGYELVRLGTIPSIRLGRRIVVPQVAIDRMIDPWSSENG